MKTPQDKGRAYEKNLDEDEINIPLSGAGRLKEDSKTPDFLKQKKHTIKESYSIKLKDLKNLERESFMVNRLPIFQLGFEVGRKHEEFYMLRKKDFEGLFGELKDEDE